MTGSIQKKVLDGQLTLNWKKRKNHVKNQAVEVRVSAPAPRTKRTRGKPAVSSSK